MGNVTTYTDLRAIVMEKASRPVEGVTTYPQGAWLTLSHMDWTRVDAIKPNAEAPEQVQLDQIAARNQKLSSSKSMRSAYSQPIYIMREFPSCDKPGVDLFWSVPSAFMVITRVNSTAQSQQAFEEALEERLQHEGGGKIQAYNQANLQDTLKKNVLFLYYRTLELSDVIMVTKSDSIQALLKCIGLLYTLPEVGDIYSYYCIDRHELLAGAEKSVNNDSIPLISSRFAVLKAKDCHNLLPNLRRWFSSPDSNKPVPAFFVTGTEDINVIAYGRSSREFCQIFRNILQQSCDFWSAFDDCSTRLGLDESSLFFPVKGNPSGESLGEFSVEYRKLRKEFAQFMEMRTLSKDWVRPLRELLNVLANISDNCVLQQMCSILLNGVRGIVHRVAEWPNPDYSSSQQNREIMRMVTGISYLIEHIARKEGELVHHPETRPLLFDIPANLLEFYLFFSDQCAQYFQSRELSSCGKCDYQLLLIPSLCESISIHDQFNFKRSSERLLFVEIPLGLVYNPFYVICSLVHEVAHHSGEAARHRDQRFSLLASCAAFTLADELDMGDSDIVYHRIYRMIVEQYPADKRKYMRDIRNHLLQVTDVLCQTEPFVELLWTTYLNDMEYTFADRMHWQNSHMVQYRNDRGTKYTKHLRERLREVEYLFKETYADLVMLAILDLRAEDYVRLLEEPKVPETEDNKISYFCRIERAGLVLATIDEENLLGLSGYAKKGHPFADDVKRYCKVLLDEDSDPADLPKWKGTNGGYHSLEIAESILSYLKRCYRSIQTYDDVQVNQSALGLIREQFRMFAKDKRFASLAFFEAIEQYRPQIINRNL